MNEEFWNKFYSEKQGCSLNPSSFAQFFYGNYLKSNDYAIIDIGCGNGRDTFFFSQYIKCIGLDGCKLVIEANNKPNMFYHVDIKNIFDFEIPKFILEKSLCIYARFFLHAITAEEDSIFFSYVESMKTGTKLAIEFRTDKDPLYLHSCEKIGEISKTDHYRRFLNFENVCKKIESLGYSIEYSLESDGLSIANNEDPVLGRIISHKK